MLLIKLHINLAQYLGIHYIFQLVGYITTTESKIQPILILLFIKLFIKIIKFYFNECFIHEELILYYLQMAIK
jgi:hypothetical protein